MEPEVKVPKKLKTLGEVTVQCQYDPVFLPLGPQQVTLIEEHRDATGRAHTTETAMTGYWTISPMSHQEGEMPEVEITITPTSGADNGG